MVELPLASGNQTSLISDILSDRDETEAVKSLHGDDAQTFVDVVDKVLRFLLLGIDIVTLTWIVIVPGRCWTD